MYCSPEKIGSMNICKWNSYQSTSNIAHITRLVGTPNVHQIEKQPNVDTYNSFGHFFLLILKLRGDLNFPLKIYPVIGMFIQESSKLYGFQVKFHSGNNSSKQGKHKYKNSFLTNYNL